MPGNLYRRALGDSWHQLPELLRRFHADAGVNGGGTFRVRHGQGFLCARLAAWARLPRETLSSAVALTVTSSGDKQHWTRTFDGLPLVSVQWLTADGLLAERVGQVELTFRLHVEDGGLDYDQVGAGFVIGGRRVPLPRGLAPVVRARETADGPDLVNVTVDVRIPWGGLLIAYEGDLRIW